MRSRWAIFCTLLMFLAVGIASLAWGGPPAIGSGLPGAANLTPQQRSNIREYASFWCDQLASSGQDDVAKVRQNLVEPFRAPRVRDLFRYEYAQAALPQLQEIISGDNPLTAVNAMLVVGFLGTERALETIVDHCDIEDEPRFHVRLWAAKALVIAVEQESIAERDVNRALRRFGHAAGREEKWLILRRQFQALASVNGPVSREVQLSVLGDTADRMMQSGNIPCELMQAVYPALKRMRDDLIVLGRNEQQSFGRVLAPVLCDICSVAQAHWDNAQDDLVAKIAYGGAVQISESMLQLIDPELRPGQRAPKTALGRAWKDRDEPRFSADHDKWQSIISKPPYKQP